MSDYKWKFARIGGVTRVYISSAEDIKHLGELDKKMWTVLSCPVKGLEIDEQSLAYMDTNGDGQIRVDEVIGVSQWLCKVLNCSSIRQPLVTKAATHQRNNNDSVLFGKLSSVDMP